MLCLSILAISLSCTSKCLVAEQKTLPTAGLFREVDSISAPLWAQVAS